MKKKHISDPFQESSRIREEVDRAFDNFFETSKPLLGFGGEALQRLAGVRSPISSITETESAVIATFEIPGVNKEDIELNIGENSIEVRVQSRLEKEKKEKGSYSYEARSRSFYRRLPLPAEVRPDSSQASYKNGVLRVEMPKARPAKKEKAVKVRVQ